MNNQNNAKNILKQHMSSYGYDIVELPEIAPSELFLTRAGEKIIDQLLVFERYDKRLALRPEFTALAGQRYLHSGMNESVRWQFNGTTYQDNHNGTHDYHKMSIGAEFIGSTSTEADAEIIAMAVQGVQKLGIQNWHLVIGHVGLQKAFLNAFNIPPRLQEIMLSQRQRYKQGLNLADVDLAIDTSEQTDYLPEKALNTQYAFDLLLSSTRYGEAMGGRNRQDITERLLEKRQRATLRVDIDKAWALLTAWSQIQAPMVDAFDAMQALVQQYELSSDLTASLVEEWSSILDALKNYDIPLDRVTIQPDLTRNWNYYTGIVFGIYTDDENFIASGGRYDDLIHIISDGTRHVPSVGFAFYLDRMPLENVPQPLETTNLKLGGQKISRIAHQLRELGLNILLLDVEDARCDVIIESNAVFFKATQQSTMFNSVEDLFIILKDYLYD